MESKIMILISAIIVSVVFVIMAWNIVIYVFNKLSNATSKTGGTGEDAKAKTDWTEILKTAALGVAAGLEWYAWMKGDPSD